MVVALRSVLPIILLSAFILLEEWISVPSCEPVIRGSDFDDRAVAREPEYHPDNHKLKVMLVANLLLLGSESSSADIYFRDYYMAKFFRKSFYSVKPDMLLVLGDVSAKGSELTRTQWSSVLRQFHTMLGPFLDIPFHVRLGDRDVGDCTELDSESIKWIAKRLPGLDSAGCGAFEISNISFVSLNDVALLCGSNELRYTVEKVIEGESSDLRIETGAASRLNNDESNIRKPSNEFEWRENTMSYGSGPVVVLHFPLHQMKKIRCRKDIATTEACIRSNNVSNKLRNRINANSDPYDLLETVPPNATEYILQALRPRIVFSAHKHEFCDHTHSDGTREVYVPAMSWKARDDPGFIVATFNTSRRVGSISYCSLIRESHVLMGYISFLVLLAIMSLTNIPSLRSLKR